MTNNIEHPFAIFAGETYYPTGGWDDLFGKYATLEEAMAACLDAAAANNDWLHVIDLRDGTMHNSWSKHT